MLSVLFSKTIQQLYCFLADMNKINLIKTKYIKRQSDKCSEIIIN